jgi:hypothetical protein
MAMPGNLPPVRAGDRVRLSSGSAVMTAERVHDDVPSPFAMCTWMDARERIQRAFVNLDALVVVRAEDLDFDTS